MEPRILAGAVAIDDRGEVSFVNEFDLSRFRRFYTVRNHRPGFVRAWHAHRYEGKAVTAVGGAALVGAVLIDDWEKPSKDALVVRRVLSAKRPEILLIPPGYANGFMTLTEDTVLLFFSTVTVDESRADDVRYDSRYWDIWHVAER